jgi:glycosyltransferase involved in cell wall biosynthesis
MTTVGILATARQRHGGTLLYTLSMIDALSRLPAKRYRFVIFAASDNHEYDILGLPIVRMPGLLGLLGRKVIGSSPFNIVDKVIAPVYSTALLACGKPFAFTLHDLQERYYPGNFSLATRLWRWLSNRLLTARATRIICESTFVQRDIVQFFGVPESKVALVPAPPIAMVRDSIPNENEIATVRQKFDLPLRYIFYPAQFWPHKNHLRLVEAFRLVLQQHSDCCLVLTGKKRDEFNRVFARVGELGLDEKVRHLGYVEQSELAALYRSATVTAIPTLFESISIPVYEAFSVGSAVCASNVVALPEQIGDAGLLFDPHSTKDMAEKICALLSNPDLRAKLIERGYRRMASVTHEQCAERLAKIIDEIGLSGSQPKQ